MENSLKNSGITKKNPHKRYVLLLLPVIFILAAFDVLAIIPALALAGVIIMYFLFSDYSWILVLLAPLGLVFGTIINIEIKPTWIYEISLGEIFIMTAFAMYVIDLFFNYESLRPQMKALGWLLLTYMILGAASYWHVKDYELYVAGLKTLAFSFTCYFLAINLLNTPERRRWFLYVLAIAVGILSIQVFYKFYELSFSLQLFNERNIITVPMGAIAFVSAAIAFILPLLLAFYFDLKKSDKGRVLVLIAFLMGFVAVFIMLGKAALFSLFVALGYLFIKLKTKRVAFILFVSFFMLVGYIALSDYSAGLVRRLTSVGTDSSTQFRLQEYGTAYGIVEDNPWFGVGSGQQLALYQRLIHPDYSEAINNYFLQAVVDFGIVGLAFFTFIVFSVFSLARRLLKQSKKAVVTAIGFAGAMIVVAINGLVEVTVFALPYAILLWLVIGVFETVPEKEAII